MNMPKCHIVKALEGIGIHIVGAAYAYRLGIPA